MDNKSLILRKNFLHNSNHDQLFYLNFLDFQMTIQTFSKKWKISLHSLTFSSYLNFNNSYLKSFVQVSFSRFFYVFSTLFSSKLSDICNISNWEVLRSHEQLLSFFWNIHSYCKKFQRNLRMISLECASRQWRNKLLNRPSHKNHRNINKNPN